MLKKTKKPVPKTAIVFPKRGFHRKNRHFSRPIHQVWIFDIFHWKTAFVTKLNDITTFCTSQGRESFLLLPDPMEPSLVSICKNGFRVIASKRMFTVLLYMGRLAVRHPSLISVKRGLLHNFLCELHFRMINVFMGSEGTFFEKRETEKYWWK